MAPRPFPKDVFSGNGAANLTQKHGANDCQRDRRVEDGGQLEMLRVVGVPNAELFTHQEPGTRYDVEWVPVPDPDPTYPEGTPWIATLGSVSSQGFAAGGALFSRLEGIPRRGEKSYFSSTQGGQGREGASSTFGQIWVLDLKRMRLSLVFEAPPVEGVVEPGNLPPLSLPDHIAISPQGGRVLCEDGTIDNPDAGFVIPHNFVRGLSRDGELFDFAENRINDSEFTGACFSRDGHTMFVNMQGSGAHLRDPRSLPARPLVIGVAGRRTSARPPPPFDRAPQEP